MTRDQCSDKHGEAQSVQAVMIKNILSSFNPVTISSLSGVDSVSHCVQVFWQYIQ